MPSLSSKSFARALVQPPTSRPGSRKQSVTSRTSKASGDSNVIFSKVAAEEEEGNSVEDQIKPCPELNKSFDPSETDSGIINPNFRENNSSDQANAKPPNLAEDQLQPSGVDLVHTEDDEILLPEVVETLIPEDEKTEK